MRPLRARRWRIREPEHGSRRARVRPLRVSDLPDRDPGEPVIRQRPLRGELREAHRDSATDRLPRTEARECAEEETIAAGARRGPRRHVRAVQIDLGARAVAGDELELR